VSERQIHINRAGQAYGPYPEAAAREILAAGQLLPSDFAWHEGAPEWKPLSEILQVTVSPAQSVPLPAPKPAEEGPKRQLTGAKPREWWKRKEEEDDPERIHITRKGKAIGPCSRERAKEFFIAGTLLPTDWGWHDGMGEDWKPLNEVLGLLVEETGSSKTYNPAKKRRDPTSVLKEKRADERKLRLLLILVALDGVVWGFMVANKDFVFHLKQNPSFWWVFGVLQSALGSGMVMLYPEITPLVRLRKALSRWVLKAVLWLPQKILKRRIDPQITAKRWTFKLNYTRIQGGWKKPYALAVLVATISFAGSFLIFKIGQKQDKFRTPDETAQKVVSYHYRDYCLKEHDGLMVEYHLDTVRLN
jgi:hypothetical protein